MNEHEYLYLGKMVAALLEEDRGEWGHELWVHQLSWGEWSASAPRWVDDTFWAERGRTPIAALEAALTALGIALPERGGGWTVFDPDDDETWPAHEMYVWASTKYGYTHHAYYDWEEGQWWGDLNEVGCGDPIEIETVAWKPIRMPEPYQEAQR